MGIGYFENGHFEEKDIVRYIKLKNLNGENREFAHAFQKHLCECPQCRKTYELYEKLVDTADYFASDEKRRKELARRFILEGESAGAKSALKELEAIRGDGVTEVRTLENERNY